MQFVEFGEADTQAFHHRGRDGQGPLTQGDPGVGELDIGRAFIAARRLRVSRPSASSRLSMGERVAESSCRAEAISLTDNGECRPRWSAGDPTTPASPGTGMGQAQRLEQRPVHGEHGAVADGQRETDLSFESQGIGAEPTGGCSRRIGDRGHA